MDINRRERLVWPITWFMWKWFGLTIKLKPWLLSGNIFKQAAVILPVLVFVVADILFNIFIGTFLFWEWPRQLLFTDRLEDHKYGAAPNSTPESQKIGVKYCKLLGIYDPGHCS